MMTQKDETERETKWAGMYRAKSASLRYAVIWDDMARECYQPVTSERFRSLPEQVPNQSGTYDDGAG
jgi:hypothetical protein